MKLTYTRYVDDITISGKYDLSSSSIKSVLQKIFRRHGFSLAEDKTQFGRLDQDICVTGNRVGDTHITPSANFLKELDRLIDDHMSLASNGPFKGPLLVGSELFGKAHHACYINPGLKRMVLARLKKIDWCAVMNNAVERELCRYREKKTERGAPRPNAEEPLPLVAGNRAYKQFCETQVVDSNKPPWE